MGGGRLAGETKKRRRARASFQRLQEAGGLGEEDVPQKIKKNLVPRDASASAVEKNIESMGGESEFTARWEGR